MKTNIFLISVMLVLGSSFCYAQSPESFNFQAVVRDAGGNVLTNMPVQADIKIWQSSTGTTLAFEESHNVTTNGFGLINLQVGSVNTTDMALIDWAAGPYFIEVIIDGTSVSTTQLLSVPYAMHAKTAESVTETDPVFIASPANGISSGDITTWNNKLDTEVDGSVTNELQILTISNDTIYLSDGGFVKIPAGFSGDYNDLTGAPANVSVFTNDAGYLISEVDGSVTNELQALTISNDTIYLSNGGFVKLPLGFDGQYTSLTGAPTNVSDFVNDAGYLTTEVDGSVTNELQVLSISNDTIRLSNGGFVKLPAGFDGQYTSLTGVPTNVSAFTNDAGYLTNFTEKDTMLWKKNLSNIYYNAGNVGIGTYTPVSKLSVEAGSGLSGITIKKTDGTEDFLKIINSSGVEHLSIDYTGQLSFAVGSSGPIYFGNFNNPAAGRSGFSTPFQVIMGIDAATNRFGFGGSGTWFVGNAPNALLEIRGKADEIQQIIMANSVQTTNLTEWRNSAGTALTVVDKSGNIGVGILTPTTRLEVSGGLKVDGTITDKNISLAGGFGSGIGGEINISSGYGTNARGGNINIFTGYTSSWAGAGASSDVFIKGGYMETIPSYASVQVGGGKAEVGGTNETAGGDLTLSGGNANLGNRNGGNVLILPGIASGTGINGYVGIGTTSPTNQLHISGASEKVYVMTENTQTTGQTHAGIWAKNNIGSLMGIQQYGTSYVTNNSHYTDGSHLFSTGAGGMSIESRNSNANANIRFYTNNMFERMRITVAGNVGIGTTNPSQKLDVQSGNINTSGNVMTGGTARIDATGNLINIGNITATGATTYTSGAGTLLKLQGGNSGSAMGGGINLTGGTSGNNIAGAAVSLNGGPGGFNGTGGAVTLTGGTGGQSGGTGAFITVNGGGPNYGAGGNLVLSSGLESPGNWWDVDHNGAVILAINGTEYMRVDGDRTGYQGFVGIGTITPMYKLDVAGMVNASGGFCINGDCKTSWSSISPWLFNSSDIYFNSGKVGIGTSTPSADLEVNGNVKITGNFYAPGTVVQTVIRTSEVTSSLNVTTFTEANVDYRISFTPKYDNSIILIEYSFSINTAMATNTIYQMQLIRDIGGTETLVGAGPANGNRSQTTYASRTNNGTDTNDMQTIYMVAKDDGLSVGTTYTYGFKFRRETGGSGTCYFNYNYLDNSIFGYSGVMTMKVTEIAQ